MSVNDRSNALFFKGSRTAASVDKVIDYTQKMKNAIEVQMIDTNMYMSQELWLPNGGWGAFGGQITAQALYAAYDTVPKDFLIHSLHAYFILANDPNTPVIYTVQKIRDGRSFATRIVKATQKGKVTFICSFSFTTPDKTASLDHQDDMPVVADPDTLPSDLVLLDEALAANEHIPKKVKQRALNRVQDVQPIEYKSADGHTLEEIVTGNIKPNPRLRRWFKTRGVLDDEQRLHDCVIAWASDSEFISSAGAANGYTFKSASIGMMATLDHAIWFHVPARTDEWVLYDTYSPRTASGRGVVFGKMYSRSGTLIASTAQEAAVRLTGPAQEKLQKAQEELQKELLQNLSNSKL